MAGDGFRAGEIRRHNLAVVLEQVHRDGPLSRAELTERVGLQRSTVRSLVVDLTKRGLLLEVPSGPDGRTGRAGRPSTVVGTRNDGPYAIAVDVTADSIISVAVGLASEILVRRETVLLPDEMGPTAVGEVIAAECDHLIRTVLPHAWPVGVGVSVPGTVAPVDGAGEVASSLGWRCRAFASSLAQRLGELDEALSVKLHNDADLGVLAEQVWGAARGCDNVVYLTARTTLRAGVLVNGRPMGGHVGLAGSIGHLELDPSGPPCHCGRRGCVETYLGREALVTIGAPTLVTVEGSPATEMRTVSGVEAAERLRMSADALGKTIAVLAAVLNPQRVLLDGLLGRVLETARVEVEAAVRRHVFDAPGGIPQIGPACLGENSALLGAAVLAFQPLLADPSDRLWRQRRGVTSATR